MSWCAHAHNANRHRQRNGPRTCCLRGSEEGQQGPAAGPKAQATGCSWEKPLLCLHAEMRSVESCRIRWVGGAGWSAFWNWGPVKRQSGVITGRGPPGCARGGPGAASKTAYILERSQVGKPRDALCPKPSGPSTLDAIDHAGSSFSRACGHTSIAVLCTLVDSCQPIATGGT